MSNNQYQAQDDGRQTFQSYLNECAAYDIEPSIAGAFHFAWQARHAQTEQQHPDDAAVNRFAAAMKSKLAAARAKGRGGWDDPNVCTVEFLAQLLVEHLCKGNAGTFEDVANFAMMLHQRGADPKVLAEAAEAPIKKARGEALELGVRALESKSEHTEPAQAQDELLPCPFCGRPAATAGKKATRFPWFKKVACSNDGCGAHFAYWHPDEWNRRATRPAQTEQQPLIYINPMVVDELEGKRKASPGGLTWSRKACAHWTFPLYAAPIAQTAQGGEAK